MGIKDAANNPIVALLAYEIESLIVRADNEAKGKGITLYDSHIRTALNKARLTLQGRKPDMDLVTERDQLIATLIHSILMKSNDTGPVVETEDHVYELYSDHTFYLQALEAIESSVKNRKIDKPGWRGYLDFIQGFIAKIGKKK